MPKPSGPAERFWSGVDVAAAPDDVVALGDDLAPSTLYSAYRHGCFPWPAPGWPSVPWFSPRIRAVLPVDRRHISRSLRATLRHSGWTTTLDRSFEEVVAGCAARPSTWITPAVAAAYQRLHRIGWAHSLEVWAGESLVGGIYGVLTGGVFSAESMFHVDSDASKAALADLTERLDRAGGRLVDCQQSTDHLRRMGSIELPRGQYLALLYELRDLPIALDPARLGVARLAPPAP